MIRNKENINPIKNLAGFKKPQATNSLIDNFSNQNGFKGKIACDLKQVLGNVSFENSSCRTTRSTIPSLASALEKAKVRQEIQDVPDYTDEIFEHLKESEETNMVIQGFMSIQSDINEKMRAILNDWLVDVHLKFKLLPETLFLTFNLIDRFLAEETVHRSKLQCVGVSAMLIASKYEEIYAPEVRDFVYITDNAYTRQEILKMEKKILTTLKFEILCCTPWRILEHIQKRLNFSKETFQYAQFLSELAQIDYSLCGTKPSLLAAASSYIAMKRFAACDSTQLYGLFQFSDAKIKEVAKKLLVKHDEMQKSSLQAVFKKFSSTTFGGVAKKQF